jgi:transposase InsO family protein
MSQTISPSTGTPYGLARTCRVWRVARSTVYWQRQAEAEPRRRPGPQGPCSDDDRVGHIRTILQASPFHGEGYRKVWARLRYAGMRTSPRRVLRVMREHALLAPTRRGNPYGPKAHDGTIIPAGIDTMWGTDMTATFTRADGQVAIYLAVDHLSAECVGIHAAKHGTRFEALEPIRQGVRAHFGVFGQDVACGLVLRHDHGSQYRSQVFQDEVTFLGIESSPAFVCEPQGNGCAERFIRTLKENLLWITTFDTVEELRVALLEFKDTYNETWLIGRHGYKTPSQVRQEQLAALAKQAA